MTMIMKERFLLDEGEKKGILSVASEMLKNYLPIDFISKMTKLSYDEILKLKNELALS